MEYRAQVTPPPSGGSEPAPRIPEYLTAGSKKRLGEQKRIENYKMRPYLLEPAFDAIAEGITVREIAQDLDVSYQALHALLVSPMFRDKYDMARKAHSDLLVESTLRMADSVELGMMEGKEATSATKIRQWYAERVNKEEYAPSSSVDMKVTGLVNMHMEAVRALSEDDSPFGNKSEDIEDADWTEVSEASEEGGDPLGDAPAGLDDHPLL